MEQSGVAEAVTTGHPQVDDVLASLESLEQLPVEQHVELFEAAHVALRNALSGADQTAHQPAQG